MQTSPTYLSIKHKTVDDVFRNADNQEQNECVIKKLYHRLTGVSADQVPRVVERVEKFTISSVWLRHRGVKVTHRRRTVSCVFGVAMNKQGKDRGCLLESAGHLGHLAAALLVLAYSQ